jgi:type II secretory ATPase GspE/PulE/Tfp pilus assembly ATPase PilB-like protein
MRLNEMGIKIPLIVSVLQCAFAQRLVRKICPRCKTEYLPEEYILRNLNLSLETTFYRGEGCKSCDGVGYRGMTGIFEVLTLDHEMKKMIANNASELEIKEAAKKKGMKTMLEDGLLKARQGITTLEEVMRLATEE